MKKKMTFDSEVEYGPGGEFYDVYNSVEGDVRSKSPFSIGEFLDECGIPAKSRLIRQMADALVAEELAREFETEGEPPEKRRRHLILVRPTAATWGPKGFWAVHLWTPKSRAAGERSFQARKLFQSSYEALEAVTPLVSIDLIKVSREKPYASPATG